MTPEHVFDLIILSGCSGQQTKKEAPDISGSLNGATSIIKSKRQEALNPIF